MKNETQQDDVIEIGDTVRCLPSIDTWTVARVQDGRVYPMIFTFGLSAELEQCELVRKATSEEKEAVVAFCRELPEEDARHIP